MAYWDVNRRVTPSIRLAGTHSYTWVKRCTVTVTHLELNGLNFSENKPDYSSLKNSITLVKVRKVLRFTSQLATGAGS